MDIIELLTRDGVTPKKIRLSDGGEKYVSLHPGCPINGKSESSFYIWPEEGKGGRAWCSACGWKGDAVRYLRETRNMGFLEACKYLGVEPNGNKELSKPEGEGAQAMVQPKEYAIPSDVWRSKANEFLRVSIESLLSGRYPAMMKYLSETRGFTRETIERHRLGFNPDDKAFAREEWDLPKVKDAGGREKKLWLPKGVVIPSFQDGLLQRIRIGSWGQDGKTKLKVREYYVPGSSLAPVVINNRRNATVVVLYDLDGILLSQELGDRVNVISLGHPKARPDKNALGVIANSGNGVFYTLSGMSDEHQDSHEWWLKNINGVKRWPYPEGDGEYQELKAGMTLKAWIMSGFGTPIEAVEKPEIGSKTVKKKKSGNKEDKYRYPDVFGETQVYLPKSREDAIIFFILTKYVRAKRYKAGFEPLFVSDGRCSGLAAFFSGEARFIVRVAAVENRRFVLKGYGLTYGAPEKLVAYLKSKARKYDLDLVSDDQGKKVYLTPAKNISLDRPKNIGWVVESMRNFVLEVGDYWI